MVISCRSGSAQGRKSNQLRTHEAKNDFMWGVQNTQKGKNNSKNLQNYVKRLPKEPPTASSTGERLDYAVKNKNKRLKPSGGCSQTQTTQQITKRWVLQKQSSVRDHIWRQARRTTFPTRGRRPHLVRGMCEGITTCQAALTHDGCVGSSCQPNTTSTCSLGTKCRHIS